MNTFILVKMMNRTKDLTKFNATVEVKMYQSVS